MGLYRDGGLAVLRNTPGSSAERVQKDITAVFQSFGLKVTIAVNLKVVNYLDVTCNLETGKYKPFRKPDHALSKFQQQLFGLHVYITASSDCRHGTNIHPTHTSQHQRTPRAQHQHAPHRHPCFYTTVASYPDSR